MLDGGKALGVARRVAERMPEGGFFAGMHWRTSPEPFALPPHLSKDLEKLGYRLWKFLKACDLLYLRSVKGTMPSWIAGWLDAGKPEDVIRLGRERALLGKIPGIIRPDIIPTEDGYILSEIDSVPGGIGLTAWLNQVYSAEGFAVLGGANGMFDGFASVLPGGGQIFVSEEAASYRPEMEWLAASLNETHGGSYRVRGQDEEEPWTPAVYRFFEMFDLQNIPSAGSLMSKVAAGETRLTAPPKAYLEEKMWFAFFWLKPLESFWRQELGSGIFEALRRCIPRTWLVDPEPLPPQAVYPGLDVQSWEEVKHFSQTRRHLVLKVSGFSEMAWGARGVTVGHDVSGEDWSAAMDVALQRFSTQPHILQEFHSGAVLPARFFDNDSLVDMPARARICPYYFPQDGGVLLGGALATLCPKDKKILHGMTDAILCPVT